MMSRLGLRLSRAHYQRQRRRAFRRPFDSTASRRVLLLAVDHPIPQSQLFPFHYYEGVFREKYDADIREVPVESDLDVSLLKSATTVCIQTHFDISSNDLTALVTQIRSANPTARLVYLDWFAPTDLRLAARVGPLVDAYLSKHLLRDRSQYGAETFGDTTLMDYYGRAHDLDHEAVKIIIPNGFMDELHLGPSFATADFLLPAFDRLPMPGGPRPVDLHARIAVEGTPWYHAMRRASAEAVAALEDVRTITGFGVRHETFLKELRASKICFSPFGYGEVCWRDYEALLCGATLLKQNMSHVETAPDIFVPNVTYAPVKWDLSDFGAQVRWLLNDTEARREIARNAYDVLQDYARSAVFTQQMAPALFGDAAP